MNVEQVEETCKEAVWDCWSSTKKAKVAAKPQADIRTINIR